MKALVYEKPWSMPLRQLEPPAAGPGEVVVAVRAAGICGSDVHGFTGSTGRRTPGIVMGHEFSGAIAALGEGVQGWQLGERVVVQPLRTCGSCALCRAGRPNVCANRTLIGMSTHGAYAEAVRVPQEQLFRLPDNLSWEQGALVEPLAVALHAVNSTPLQIMDSVVVVGAGPIGLLTMLAARLKGAGTVIATDRSQHRLALAQQFGADIVVNVDEQDPAEVVFAATAGRGADCAFEVVGSSATVQQALALTSIGGQLTWIGNAAPEIALNMQQVVTREITIRGVYGFHVEFAQAIAALSMGRIDAKPLIERVAPLEDGPQLFHDLASGAADMVKVVLLP